MSLGGEIMKKYASIVIGIVASLGVLILVLDTAFDEGSNLWNGLALFKYFTLQSNLIVAVYFMIAGFGLIEKDWFHRLLGGVTVYVTVTLVVFIVFLEGTYQHTGWGIVSNILAHYLSPILTISFLVYFRKEYMFSYGDILTWMLYPISYVLFMTIFGTLTGDYIYPFFQIPEVGVGGFLLMVGGLVVFFGLLSFGAVKIVSKR
jgi:hypothetical protein